MQEVLASFLTELVKLILDWYFLPLVVSVTVWVLRRYQREVGKLTAEQLATIQFIVGIAIKAAEQSGLKGRIKDEAGAKLDFAVNFVVDQLTRLKFKQPDLQLIREMIEAGLRDGVHKGYEVYNASFTGAELPFGEIVVTPLRE